MHSKRLRDPRILALATVAIWSAGMTLGKLMSVDGPFALLTLSFFFSFLTFVIHGRIQTSTTKAYMQTTLRTATPGVCIAGPFGYFVYWLAVIQCYRSYDTVAEPVVLNYLWPIFAILFTTFMWRSSRIQSHPARTIMQAIGVLLGFASTLVMATEGNPLSLHITNSAGLFWGLLAAASQGIFSAYCGTIPVTKQNGFLLTSAGMGVVGMGLLSLSDLHAWTTIDWTDLLVVMASGLLSDGIGDIFWARANRFACEQQVSISAVASLLYLLPVLSLLVTSVAFFEFHIFTPYFAVVVALLMASSIICQLAPRELPSAVD